MTSWYADIGAICQPATGAKATSFFEFMGRSFLVGLCESTHRTGLDRPALFHHAGATVRADPARCGCTPGKQPAGWVGGLLSRVAGGVSLHASSLFFLPVQVIANGCEKFVAIRMTASEEVLWSL